MSNDLCRFEPIIFNSASETASVLCFSQEMTDTPKYVDYFYFFRHILPSFRYHRPIDLEQSAEKRFF